MKLDELYQAILKKLKGLSNCKIPQNCYFSYVPNNIEKPQEPSWKIYSLRSAEDNLTEKSTWTKNQEEMFANYIPIPEPPCKYWKNRWDYIWTRPEVGFNWCTKMARWDHPISLGAAVSGGLIGCGWGQPPPSDQLFRCFGRNACDI